MQSVFPESQVRMGLQGGVLGSYAGGVGGLEVQVGHEPPHRQGFGEGVVQEVEMDVVEVQVEEAEVVVEVVWMAGIGVVHLVVTGEIGATAEVVRLEECWAGLEIMAAGKAEVKPMMAKVRAGVERCIAGVECGRRLRIGRSTIGRLVVRWVERVKD